MVVIASCGKPGNLDAKEQLAFARACTSLIERNLSNRESPRNGKLEGETLDLDKPQEFYDAVHRLRGPETYDLHDPAHSADTARQPLDKCDVDPITLSSLFPNISEPSTTSTTTTTTAPGS